MMTTPTDSGILYNRPNKFCVAALLDLYIEILKSVNFINYPSVYLTRESAKIIKKAHEFFYFSPTSYSSPVLKCTTKLLNILREFISNHILQRFFPFLSYENNEKW